MLHSNGAEQLSLIQLYRVLFRQQQ